jgi:hypothetical protein
MTKKPSKVPPHNLDAEKAVLGSILSDSEAIHVAFEHIKETDFYPSSHVLIYKNMIELYNTEKPIDYITLTGLLKQKNLLEQTGGASYIVGLTENLPSSANVKHYIDIVREKSTLRQAIQLLEDYADKCYIPVDSPSVILTEISQKINGLANLNGSKIIKVSMQERVENWFHSNASDKACYSDVTYRLLDCYSDLGLKTNEERNACRVAFKRMVEKGKLEPIGNRTGTYRYLDRLVERTKFIKEKIEDFPVKMPFDLNILCRLYPKSVWVIAGSKGAGKTALALKIAMDNQDHIPVRYMHSEGGDEEFSDRMQNWGITHESQIRFEPIKCSRNFHDFITDEKKIFICDYLEVHKDFYEVAIPLKKIHDKLKDGIAVVCLQKKKGSLYARGDEFTQEVCRLYLSMEFIPQEAHTLITIANAKAPKLKNEFGDEEDLTMYTRKIKITRKGTQLTPLDVKWEKPKFQKKPSSTSARSTEAER